jgi:hypothetical protein
MTMTRVGRGFGVVMTVLAVVGIPSMSAFADSSCYVSCGPPTTLIGSGGGGGGGTNGGGGTSGTGGNHGPVTGAHGSGSQGSGAGSSGSGGANGRTAVSTKASGGGLPFTGADVEEMTAIGAGALLIGGILVRRGRSRRRAGI